MIFRGTANPVNQIIKYMTLLWLLKAGVLPLNVHTLSYLNLGKKSSKRRALLDRQKKVLFLQYLTLPTVEFFLKKLFFRILQKMADLSMY